MSKEYIVMIAAGMKKKKKEFMNEDTENMYLNYGLLGLASILYEKGYENVKMFQGDSKTVDELIDEIQGEGIEISKIKFPIFLSIPSFLALSWAEELIRLIKGKSPNSSIVVGGRWVIDNNLEWIRKKLPQVDFFSQGCPDKYIDKLLNPLKWENYKVKGMATEPFEKFEYQVLYEYLQYQPTIEISRGCGRKCDFCLEKDYPVSKVKCAKKVIQEAKQICTLYNDNYLNFYFEASIFNPTYEWAEEFRQEYHENDMRFKWRFETRVDSINQEVIPILAEAGLKVLDLGLESASYAQLLRMEKTKKPLVYLNKASSLLKTCTQYQVWPKLNILLYLGETKKTISETKKWLDEQRRYFKGVSVNPFFLYLNGEENTVQFINKIENISMCKVQKEKLFEEGYTMVDLSEEINIEAAMKIAKELAQDYMTQEDYQDLKSVCYLKRVASQ